MSHIIQRLKRQGFKNVRECKELGFEQEVMAHQRY